jgi:hypothetical protein
MAHAAAPRAGARVTLGVVPEQSLGIVRFSYATASMSGAATPGPLLMYAMPHHTDVSHGGVRQASGICAVAGCVLWCTLHCTVTCMSEALALLWTCLVTPSELTVQPRTVCECRSS